MDNCNCCGADNVELKHWKLPSDEDEEFRYYGCDYCRSCWERVVKPLNLQERNEPAPEFDD